MSDLQSRVLTACLAMLLIPGITGHVWGDEESDDPLADPHKVYRDRLADDEIQRVLKLVPRSVTKVLDPPADWKTLRFDTIELKLPLGTNWLVFHTNTSPNLLVLYADPVLTNRFSVSSLGPYPEPATPYPPTSYYEMKRIISTIPDDLTGADTVELQRDVVIRLLAKAVNQSKYVHEWMFVETPVLKAMIHRSPPGRHGFGSAHMTIWNPAGTVYFYVMAAREISPEMGQQILGGVRFHGDTVSPERVQAAIGQLRLNHSRQGLPIR